MIEGGRTDYEGQIAANYSQLETIFADLESKKTDTAFNPLDPYGAYGIDAIRALRYSIQAIEGMKPLSIPQMAKIDDAKELLGELEELVKPKQAAASKENVNSGASELHERAKRDILRFLSGIQIPQDAIERKAGQSVESYVSTLFPFLIKRLAVLIWNKTYDDAASPYTKPYQTDPTRGPDAEIAILKSQLVYDDRDDNLVKTFESLFDQFSNLFEDAGEQKEARGFAGRMKAVFSEMTVLHNRAVIRRHNESKAGPDAALSGIEKIFNGSHTPDLRRLFDRTNMTDPEKRFSRATEFCMSVWSVMHLKMHERVRLWPYISPKVKDFFDDKSTPGNPKYVIKKEYDIIPDYKTNPAAAVAMIEKIITEATDILGPMGDSQTVKMIAEVAYQVGEAYRIGFGMDAFYDVGFEVSKRTGKSFAKVAAKEGEPKAALVGAYAESTNENPSRENFNKVYEDYLFHGYMPLSRALQYNHSAQALMVPPAPGGLVPRRPLPARMMPLDISGMGDMRASVAEILSVPDAIATVDWSTSSSKPDKIVYDQAVEAAFLWEASAVKNIASGKQVLSWPMDIPLKPTQTVNEADEIAVLATEFDATSRLAASIARGFRTFKNVALGSPAITRIEDYGFDSDSGQIDSDKDRLADRIKHFRDYWLGGIAADSRRFPMDYVRNARFLFSRDDRPQYNYFLNPQIQRIVESAIAQSRRPIGEQVGYVSTKFNNQLAGYMWYDVVMRATIAMHAPNLDFAQKSDEFKTQQGLESIYESLDSSTYSQYDIKTMAGRRPLGLSEVMWVINRAILLRDLLSEERDVLFRDGYRLDPADHEADAYNVPFTREAVLKICKEFNLGEGYHFKQVKNQKGKLFWQLVPDRGAGVTLQRVINRLNLVKYLFNKNDLMKK